MMSLLFRAQHMRTYAARQNDPNTSKIYLKLEDIITFPLTVNKNIAYSAWYCFMTKH